jgi:hypothetical protein
LRDQITQASSRAGSRRDATTRAEEKLEACEHSPRSHAAIALDQFGGVGAVLRYVFGDEPTEEVSAAQAQDEDRK